MVSSGRKIIIPVLLLLGAVVCANAQPPIDKASLSTISGKVTIGGKGVSGLVVGLAAETRYRSISITRLRGVTDEDGNYRIKNVPPGTYQVLVSAAAYVQSDGSKSVIVGKNEVVENIDIALARGGVITGRVMDADGRPIAEEQISFSSTTPIRGRPYMRTVRTDDRGIYRAFGLPPGRYTVSAGRDSMSSFGRERSGHQRTYHPSAVNASEATLIDVNEGSEATNVDITLGRELRKYAARGHIVDGDTSQPLPNARIGIQFFFDVKGSTSIAPAAESTKDGEFKIQNLPPGKYAVYLDSQIDSERFSEAVRFEVIDQDVEGLLIRTSQGGSISGVVVLEGTHDPGVKFNSPGNLIVAAVSREYAGRTHPSATINPDGSFRVTGLPAGRLTLHFQNPGDRLRLMRVERDGVVYRGGFEIREREQIAGVRLVVSQANGAIRGMVTVAEGGVLPAQARLFVSGRRIDDATTYISPVQADARGHFLFEGLVAGTYEVTVGVVGAPNDRRTTIPRSTQTVVVTNGAIADVTITVQIPKTAPGGP